MECKYNRRVWLNKETSSMTGSIVLCDTFTYSYEDDGKKVVRPRQFLEISDCLGKIRIHNDYDRGGKEEYLDKLKLIRDEIDMFINYLENK